jgi:hypothetical protein
MERFVGSPMADQLKMSEEDNERLRGKIRDLERAVAQRQSKRDAEVMRRIREESAA